MKIWIVYESMFGNTREVAEAIARGLAGSGIVEVHEVGQVPQVPDDLDLLVVGGPTHVFGMTHASTRVQARQWAELRGQDGVESHEIGLREWLAAPVSLADDLRFATFDTRADRPRLPGSAARTAARMLRRMGFEQAAACASFWVHGSAGPLLDGERERARAWGRRLADAVAGVRTG